jgi:predicted oxidoreductase
MPPAIFKRGILARMSKFLGVSNFTPLHFALLQFRPNDAVVTNRVARHA